MATYGHTFTSGDTVTPTKLNNARTVSDIVNADIKSDAAIAGTKIAPDFGSQNTSTTGTVTASKLIPTGNSATGNGMYLPASNVLGFSTNGLERVRISSEGFLGVNTTSISSGIHASGDGQAPCLRLTNTTASTGRSFELISGNAGVFRLQDNTADAERVRVNSSGDVLIGTTTTSLISGNSSTAGAAFIGGGLYAAKSALEPLLLNKLGADGNAATFWKAGVFVGGIAVTGSSTAYNTSSDYRLKENPQPMVGALSRLADVKPVTFTWKSNGSQGEGFIAHELQAVVPEAVTGAKDAVDADGNPAYQGVDASKLVPILVAAVQELSAKVAALEAAE